SGKFSPTEAAAITVGFTMIAGLLITREISLRKLPTIMLRSGQIAGMLAPLIAISVVMQQLLSVLGAGQALSEMLSGIDNYYLTLGTCMLIILLAGMILESLPVTIILAPILAPIAQQAGVDPIHFSVIFLVGAAIGFVTPPFGLNLYVASSITGISYVRLVKYVIPYFIALIACWLAICLVPSLSLFLVNL
ncbi:TRAP transporter large permease subunit, partial [uncultured Cobetia sp.]